VRQLGLQSRLTLLHSVAGSSRPKDLPDQLRLQYFKPDDKQRWRPSPLVALDTALAATGDVATSAVGAVHEQVGRRDAGMGCLRWSVGDAA
jgi:hypothetical protein